MIIQLKKPKTENINININEERKMIYIAGAIDGAGRKILDFYISLAFELEKKDYSVYLPHIGTRDLDLTAKDIDLEIYKKDIMEMGCSDLILAYIGLPSLGTGAEIALNINDYKIPLIAFYEEGKTPSFFITGYLKRYRKKIIKISDLGLKGITELIEAIK